VSSQITHPSDGAALCRLTAGSSLVSARPPLHGSRALSRCDCCVRCETASRDRASCPSGSLYDLVKRGLRKPEFLIVDGGTGLSKQILAPQAKGCSRTARAPR
jgi:hypothetical protein